MASKFFTLLLRSLMTLILSLLFAYIVACEHSTPPVLPLQTPDLRVAQKYAIWNPDSLVPLTAFSSDSESILTIQWYFPSLDSTFSVGCLDTTITAPSREDSNFVCIVSIETVNGGKVSDTMIAWITSIPDYRIAEPHTGDVFFPGDTITICLFPVESEVGVDLKFDRYTIDILNRNAGVNPKVSPKLEFPIPDKFVQKEIDFQNGAISYDTIVPISENCVIRMTQYAVPNHYAESGTFAIRKKE